MKNYSVLLIKPDAIRKNLLWIILQEIIKKKLNIVAYKIIKLDESCVRYYQPVLNMPSDFGEAWKQDVINFMTSVPVMVVLIEGQDALQKTDVLKKEIRSRYMPEGANFLFKKIRNLLHTPSNKSDLLLDLNLFFPEIKEKLKKE